MIKTENYQTAIEKLFDLAILHNVNSILPVPKLKNPNTGSYVIDVDLDQPNIKYHLNIAGKALTLKEVRELEVKLQTRLVG